MNNLPVDFEMLARSAANGGGYPVQISASDLMRNFVFAALDVEQNGFAQIINDAGQNGYPKRKVKIGPQNEIEGGVLYYQEGNWISSEVPQEGSILYYKNGEWLPCDPPESSKAILTYDNQKVDWVEPPSAMSGFYVLGVSVSGFTWLETKNC